MEIFEIVVGLLLVVAAIFLVVTVLLQDSKSDSVSSVVMGSGDSYMRSGSAAQKKEKLFNTVTLIISIAFIVIALALYIFQPWKATADKGDFDDIKDVTAAPATTVAPTTTAVPVTTVAPAATTAPVTTVAP